MALAHRNLIWGEKGWEMMNLWFLGGHLVSYGMEHKSITKGESYWWNVNVHLAPGELVYFIHKKMQKKEKRQNIQSLDFELSVIAKLLLSVIAKLKVKECWVGPSRWTKFRLVWVLPNYHKATTEGKSYAGTTESVSKTSLVTKKVVNVGEGKNQEIIATRGYSVKKMPFLVEEYHHLPEEPLLKWMARKPIWKLCLSFWMLKIEDHVWVDGGPRAHHWTIPDSCMWSRYTGGYSWGNSQAIPEGTASLMNWIKAIVRYVCPKKEDCPIFPLNAESSTPDEAADMLRKQACGIGFMMMTGWIFTQWACPLPRHGKCWGKGISI